MIRGHIDQATSINTALQSKPQASHIRQEFKKSSDKHQDSYDQPERDEHFTPQTDGMGDDPAKMGDITECCG